MHKAPYVFAIIFINWFTRLEKMFNKDCNL